MKFSVKVNGVRREIDMGKPTFNYTERDQRVGFVETLEAISRAGFHLTEMQELPSGQKTEKPVWPTKPKCPACGALLPKFTPPPSDK